MLQTCVAINVGGEEKKKKDCWRDFEATYQQGSDTFRSYFLGSNTK